MTAQVAFEKEKIRIALIFKDRDRAKAAAKRLSEIIIDHTPRHLRNKREYTIITKNDGNRPDFSLVEEGHISPIIGCEAKKLNLIFSPGKLNLEKFVIQHLRLKNRFEFESIATDRISF